MIKKAHTQLTMAGLALLFSFEAQAVTKKFSLWINGSDITYTNISGETSGKGNIIGSYAPFLKKPGGSQEGYLVADQVLVMPSGLNNPEIRIANMSFMFSDGDQIYVQGGNNFNPKDPGLILGQPVSRVVSGGTGKYFGIRGQVIATRQLDGSYKYDFKIIK